MTRETPEIMCNGAKYYSTKQVAKAQQCKDLHFSAPFSAPFECSILVLLLTLKFRQGGNEIENEMGNKIRPHGKRKAPLEPSLAAILEAT